MNRRLGFRARLLVGAILQLVAFAATTVFVLAILTSRHAEEQAEQAIQAARASFGVQTELHLRSWRRETREFARSPRLLAVVADESASEAQRTEALRGLEAPLIALVSPEGAVLASTTDWPPCTSLREAPGFGQFPDGEPTDHVWPTAYGPALVACAPVLVDGLPKALLVRGELIDSSLAQRLSTIANNDVLLFADGELIGRRWQTSPASAVDLTSLLELQLEDLPPEGRAVALQVDGRERAGIALRLHRDGCMVFFSQDLRGVEALRAEAMAWLIGSGALLALLGVLVTLKLSTRLVRPIHDLTRAADRVGKGDLAARVPSERMDHELASLAESFNRMASTVQSLLSEVTERAKRAEAADRAKDGFLTSVSHELRTPLTGIQSTAELLKNFGEETTPEERAEFVGTILREAERLGRRISDALEFARLSGGKTRWTVGRVDLQRACEEACRRLDSMQSLKSVPFSIHCTGEAVLQGDREHVTQAIYHLVHNAWKWSPADSPVDLEVHGVQNGFVVEVSDRGPGIAKADQKRIFESFTQGGDVLVDKPSGIGIGLKIAAQVANKHGGTIEYEARKGGGARFLLLLRSIDGVDVQPDAADEVAAAVQRELANTAN